MKTSCPDVLPLEGIGKVAKVAVFLAGDDSSWVSGASLQVDVEEANALLSPARQTA